MNYIRRVKGRTHERTRTNAKSCNTPLNSAGRPHMVLGVTKFCARVSISLKIHGNRGKVRRGLIYGGFVFV
jgi:hypothetical protein